MFNGYNKYWSTFGLQIDEQAYGPIFSASIVAVIIGVMFSLPSIYVLLNLSRWNQKFTDLADQTRKVQSRDIVKAYLRIFERTQLDSNTLRTFESRYFLEKERQLFGEESSSERLGNLFNKSIRFLSWSDFKNKRFRVVKWEGSGIEEFFNPIKIVALYLTNSELVICEAEIDSIEGDLKEKIFRLMLSDIVSVGFSSKRARIPITLDSAIRIARDLKLDKIELKKIKASLAKKDTDDQKFLHEEMTSTLEITRTDAGVLQFPIMNKTFFGWHVSALDQDVPLTDDEVAVDRMMNELNRVVRSSRFANADV